MNVIIYLLGFLTGAYVMNALLVLFDMENIVILGGHGNVIEKEKGEESNG